MEDKKLLKEFYLIAEELDKNIIRFNELEIKLKEAKKANNIEQANLLLEEYRKVATNIKSLKEKSERLKSSIS